MEYKDLIPYGLAALGGLSGHYFSPEKFSIPITYAGASTGRFAGDLLLGKGDIRSYIADLIGSVAAGPGAEIGAFVIPTLTGRKFDAQKLLDKKIFEYETTHPNKDSDSYYEQVFNDPEISEKYNDYKNALRGARIFGGVPAFFAARYAARKALGV